MWPKNIDDMRGRPATKNPPVVVVWKASKHGRSKPKIKVFKTKHVDEIIEGKVHGIPDSAIILDIGVGSVFEERYKKKHKLN